MIIKRFAAAKKIKHTIKALFKDCVINTGSCFTESLLGAMNCVSDGNASFLSHFSKEFVKRSGNGPFDIFHEKLH